MPANMGVDNGIEVLLSRKLFSPHIGIGFKRDLTKLYPLKNGEVLVQSCECFLSRLALVLRVGDAK
jgi:hypothetical protein